MLKPYYLLRNLIKSDPTHPNLIQNPFVLKAVRRSSGVEKSAMRRWLGFAFGGNVTLSTSTHRHYDESVHRIKELTRGNHTIGFSDILSHIRKLEARYELFIADHSCRKIGVSASQLHYFMLLCTGSTPGKSVQAPIRL